jgi:RNA polymerase sigma-70 factor, ECF subfamily
MSSLADEEIALQVQNGDTESFGLLVERYEQKMLRYARKFLFGHHDAEDLVQEVFIKAYTNIQGFNTKRRFSPWLYRIAHNEFINAIKKKGKEPIPFFDPDTLWPHPISKEDTDRDVNEQDLKKTLDTCLDKLDPKYREPLILYYFEEMDYKAIAEVLHTPTSTIGVRLKRGKQMLKKIYQDTYEQ